MTDTWLLWLPVLLPALAGGLLLVLPRVLDRAAGWLLMVTAALVLGLTLLLWPTPPALSLPWLPGLPLTLSGLGSNAPLAVLVAVMTLLVVVYSHGFLESHEARGRYFGFMGLFLGAMELLVLADDLLALLIGWELVGLCSWALIGFWYSEPKRTYAANRAFIVTRFGDLGLYLAAIAAFAGGGSLAFATLGELPAPLAGLVALGVIIAAAGKSAQLPFTGWLSGAMQGPSPVSALLHSATLVAAGAILLIKAQPLLMTVPWAGPLVVWLGAITALTAALIALFQRELKQVLAASTASQYGYMFAALGAGGVAAGSAHLFNHAAFKGLLFLGAGVLISQGLKYLHQMGGLSFTLPRTARLMAVGLLALAAVPPLGGFFSKEILLEAVIKPYPAAGWLLVVVGGLTAAYATRAWLAGFAGQARTPAAFDAHRAGPWLWLPMAVLALAALLLGLIAIPPLINAWAEWLNAEHPHGYVWTTTLASLVLIALGVAWIWYRFQDKELVRAVPPGAHTQAAYRWFWLVDGLDWLGRGVLVLARGLARLEEFNPAGSLARRLPALPGRPELIQRLHQPVPRLARQLARFDGAVLSRAVIQGSSRL
ncbi:MAG: NADH-quinone oxidoreductase subunit L, partial [Candidatus Competibacteraceae bacterium]|nr:NADH-quinone oxidoreductase subunit L [Candidatus Competibacteraceae bacterium]